MAPVELSPDNGQKKRLAVFLDGTWDSEIGNTNVWRMKSLCAAADSGGKEQRVFYSKGVGTTFGEIVRGGAFGAGIDEVVYAAYEWLIENYSDRDDVHDEIFIFGFSRGAYTARSLSGLISRCGLPRLGSPLSVNQLYARYKKGNAVSSIHELLEPGKAAGQQNEERWMVKYCRPIPVKFTGVWDTVGAVAMDNCFAFVTGGNHAFLDVNLRKSEEFAYHALAIDEHRETFNATLFSHYAPKDESWTCPRALSDVEQRWFIGAHGDVGGGSDNDLLAQIPLQWLMKKASQHGLAFRRDIEIDQNAHMAIIDDSFAEFLKGAYRLAHLDRRFYRPIDRAPEPRTTTVIHTINETIDGSVFARWMADASYRPQNLVDWSSRHRVKPEQLTGVVRANDPGQSVQDDPAAASSPATP